MTTQKQALSFFGWISILVVGMAAGCSGSGGTNYPVEPVSGKVTLNDSPLGDADIHFQAQEGALAGFLGGAAKSDAQGNFEVVSGSQKGLPPGKYKVTVSKWVGPDGRPVVPAEGMDIEQLKAAGSAVQAIPEAFNDVNLTTVEVTVKAGTPTPPLDIAIK